MSLPLPVQDPPALRFEGLVKTFAARRVLNGLTFDLLPGQLTAVLGANGSGKSTMLRCVVGLIEPDAGQILLHGQDVQQHRHQAAMVFQQIHLVRRRTALENVCAGALGRLGLRQSLTPALFPQDVRELAMSCLEQVGMADRAHEKVSRLSGGQQQRVAIARALCQGARVVLADEPVAALDPAASEQVLALLHDLAQEQGLAVAAVLHQPDLARRHADRVVGLLHGTITLDVPADHLSLDAIDALYAPDRIAL